jgi:hypothetical protein
MKRGLFLLMVSAALVMTPVSAASGGGATFDFGSDYVVIGDQVTGRTSIWLGAKRSGEIEDGPFHAYLVPSSNDRWPEEGLPDDARWLAPISFDPLPGPSATATVTFEVPAVPPGAYSVTVCNDPCTVRSVGDLIGGWVTIAATPSQARIQELTDRVDWKTRALRQQMNREERRAEKAEEALEARVTGLQREVNLLRETTRSRPRSPDVGVPGWVAVSGWGAVVILMAAIFARRKRRKTPPPPGPEAEWIIPEERIQAKT